MRVLCFVHSWSSFAFAAISSTGQPTDEVRPKNELKSWSYEKQKFVPTRDDFNECAKTKTYIHTLSHLASHNGNMLCTI